MKKTLTPDQFMAMLEQKYNGKTRGFELFKPGQQLMNSPGDINPSSLAFQYATDRLTYIRSKIVEQTFYEVSPAEFLDVIPGEGAFSQTIITNQVYKTGSNFSAGKIDTAKSNSRVNTADAAIAPFYTYVRNWALGIDYSLFDVNQAAFSGNWDIIEAKHRARKKDWDLGIQSVAFVGDPDDQTNFPGLLTNPNVNIGLNTAITTQISTMTASTFATFVATLIGDFLSNAQQTVFPNTLIIPQDDYAGLATPVSSTYPNISMLAYLQQAFDMIVPGGKFKILPSAYAIGSAACGGSAIGHHRYMLYRRDIDTLFMELPVDYQVTAAGTYNNFQFQDVAYGQYAGVSILRPLECKYYDLSS
jgi:hypothetical protein